MNSILASERLLGSLGTAVNSTPYPAIHTASESINKANGLRPGTAIRCQLAYAIISEINAPSWRGTANGLSCQVMMIVSSLSVKSASQV